MAGKLIGPYQISLNVDDNGYRDYNVGYKVQVELGDGPLVAALTAGLPEIGSSYSLRTETDPWAFCWPTSVVTPLSPQKDEPYFYYSVGKLFTTRPRSDCRDGSDNPLLLPPRVSGGFIKYTKEITEDFEGKMVRNSAFELIRGAIVEFDHNRPTIQIEQNVSTLEYDLCAGMMDTVNEEPLWGFDARCVKLSNFTWASNVFGTCNEYYTRFFEFDIDPATFDRFTLDEGTKVLNGHWEATGWVLDDIDGEPPDPDNPQHFIRFRDRTGEVARVLLDGNGEPLGGATGTADDDDPAVRIHIKYYPNSNFLELGIPSTIGN
jgi:hypothetical protein